MIVRFFMVAFLAAFSNIAYAKNCTKGQPCGNSCISWSDTCHIGTYTPTPTPTVTKYPPTAYFTLSQSSGAAPLAISLDASYSTATGAVINIYQWSASNGQSTSGKAAAIVFSTPGTYTVTLTVTDSNGMTATSQKTVTVSATPTPVSTPAPATPVVVKCANATYTSGRLNIPALDVPVAFNQNATYQIAMDDVMFSPSEFTLASAVTIVGTSGCQNATYSPNTGIVAIPVVEVPGVGQYNVDLLVVPGADPMRFRLLNATVK